MIVVPMLVAAAIAASGASMAGGAGTPADSDAFVAEAVMGTYVMLPVTVHGERATVILDVGSDDSWLFRPVLAQMRIATAYESDSLSFGSGVTRRLPIRDAAFSADADFAPTVGLVGADILSKYDLLFDGPGRRVRLYAPPVTGPAAAWLPPGIAQKDCVPLEVDPRYPDRIFFPLRVNGRSIHSMFDSGSPSTNTNLAGARALGITKRTPTARLLPAGLAGQFMTYTGQKVWSVSSGLTFTIGARSLDSVPLYIYQHLPREADPTDAELSLGLDAIRDRVLFVSYSTRRVCVGAPVHRASTTRASAVATGATIPNVVLTDSVLARMTAFWAAWTREPPAVRDTGRILYQMALPVALDLPVSEARQFTLPSVVNMRAMAEHYPSIAAALAASGLTAAQWEEYRHALFSAVLANQMGDVEGSVVARSTPKSAIARNAAFLRAHPDAFGALRATGMWFPSFSESRDFGGDLDP